METKNQARKMLKGIVGTRDESVDDVVKFMLDYAESMRKRQKDAADGDKMLSCSTIALRMEDTASRIKAALRREQMRARQTPKLKNPPPKRVRLTKRLGYEALKLLRYIDFRMAMTKDMLDFQDWKRQVSDDMCAVLANMGRWWDGEKRKRKDRKDA